VPDFTFKVRLGATVQISGASPDEIVETLHHVDWKPLLKVEDYELVAINGNAPPRTAPDKIACPFVYSDGRKCTGHVYRARAYGRRSGADIERQDVRKYRLWCSEKDDHAGAVSGFIEKRRMEFYLDQLPPGVEEALWQSDILEV
jgi:hypothetical protein